MENRFCDEIFSNIRHRTLKKNVYMVGLKTRGDVRLSHCSMLAGIIFIIKHHVCNELTNFVVYRMNVYILQTNKSYHGNNK